MDDRERPAIIEAKDKWLVNGNIGGAAACDFLLMQDTGLDIIYHAENELVKEYRSLLQKRLETDNVHLMLMAHTEIERCFLDEKDELCIYLSDEIYEHFQRSGKEYPIQVVWLHLDVVAVLFYMGYVEKSKQYMHIFHDTQEKIFGDKSFLFCRNWCHIIDEVMLMLFPDEALVEFYRYMDLFSKVLIEEDILYKLCMGIATAKVKHEQKAHYLRQAVELCEDWCKELPIKQHKEKYAYIRIMSAINYRNIGEIGTAIEEFWQAIHLTENVQSKLFALCQIASMLFIQRELSTLQGLLEEGERLIALIQEPDGYVAGFYNVCGLYYTMKGQYDEALIQFDKAIAIGGRVMGQNADDTIRFKYCKLMAEYDMGKIDEVSKQMSQLYQIVFNDMEHYVQSYPLIFSATVMMGLESNASSETVKRMKKSLNNNQNKYDLSSVLLSKCNLYYLMMSSEDIYDRDDWEPLQRELEEFFVRYPYAEGSLQYLKGEYYRCLKKEDISSVSNATGKVLDKIEAYFFNTSCAVGSMTHFHYYYIELRNLLYKKNYAAAAKRLLSMRKIIIIPLLEALCNIKEDSSESVFIILNSYASLFVSTVQQYPQLRITAKELYEFVLNMKCFEDLFYCCRQEFYSAVEQRRWLSETDINIRGEDLIIECYDYNRSDMKDIGAIFRVFETDMRSLVYQIYFGIHLSSSIFSKPVVEVIGNIPFMELHKRISNFYDSYDMKKVSEIERVIWDKLQKFLNKKKKVFFCGSNLEVLMPLAFIRINADQYFGDCYQIIYCNTAKDIKGDVEVQDISNSIFFGMSKFDGDKVSQGIEEMQKRFRDLPLAGLEVEVLGVLTGGGVYLDEKKPKEWFSGQSAEIIHFATHTLRDETDGTISLITEKNDNGSYSILQDEDISKMNWNGVKLAVFSACDTGEEEWTESGKRSLRMAAKKAGALFSISSYAKIDDEIGFFFMMCFYKNLLRHGRICGAFFETQKMVRTITKKEILTDYDFLYIGMEDYLQNYEEDSRPFGQGDGWALYLLQMN